MKPWRTEDINAGTAAMNSGVLGGIGQRYPAAPKGTDAKSEADLQASAERYLKQHGFVRLTPQNAESFAGVEIVGWFGHLFQPIGNAMMPDLFVFANGLPPLLVELKVREVYRMGQREMIDAGWWKLARNMDEFIAHYMAWRGYTNEPPA